MQRNTSTSRNPAAAAPWGWAIAGALLGVVIAVVLFAPARWLSAVINQASAGQVRLIEPRGTLWNGSARLLLTGGSGSRDSAALPGQIDWQLPGLAGAELPIHRKLLHARSAAGAPLTRMERLGAAAD